MTSLLDPSDPVVATLYVTIAGLVASVVINILQARSLRRLRRAEKGLDHSRVLVRDAFRPWSETRQVFDGDGIPSLLPSDSNLAAKPSFRWAQAHLRSGYPKLAATWDQTNTLVGEEAQLIRDVREIIARKLAEVLQEEFGGVIESVDGYPRDRWNVCYLQYVTERCWTELRRVAARGDDAPEIEVKSESVGGAAQLGYKIAWSGLGGTEIARVKREIDAAPQRWQGLLGRILNAESIRDPTRSVFDLSRLVDAGLKAFQRGTAEIIERVDNGLPLKGSCEVEVGLR